MKAIAYLHQVSDTLNWSGHTCK